MKKVTVNETVTSHERYLYRGYLQTELCRITLLEYCIVANADIR